MIKEGCYAPKSKKYLRNGEITISTLFRKDFFSKNIVRRLNTVQFKLFIIVFVIYIYFLNGFHSANELSRYSLIRAIVEERTFVIDNYIFSLIDISFYNGHFYSDKPPGLSFVGVPVYFIAKFIVSSFWIPYLLISLITLISSLSVVLIYEIVGILEGNNTTRLLTSFTYAFGTIAWVYSKTFFSHGASAFLILLSMYCAYLFVRENKNKFILFSGIAIGYSILVEYSNLFLLFPFLIYFLLYKTKKRLIYFLVPIILFLIILGTYNYVCFGSPFNISYMYTYTFGNLQSISAYSNPVHIGLYGLLFSPYRGLFYISPILLLSPFGFFLLFKKYKPETVLFLSSFIIIILFYSSFTDWHGGMCYGPRYLLSVVPFITLPISQVIEKYRGQKSFLLLFFILMGYSIFANALGVLASYHVPDDVANPLFYNLMYLLNGGGIDSNLFSTSPITILFPIVLIFICIHPRIISVLRKK